MIQLDLIVLLRCADRRHSVHKIPFVDTIHAGSAAEFSAITITISPTSFLSDYADVHGIDVMM